MWLQLRECALVCLCVTVQAEEKVQDQDIKWCIVSREETSGRRVFFMEIKEPARVDCEETFRVI